MDLTLDDDQRLLAESARQLFERTYPTSEARKAEERPERFSADLWTQAGELGWPGIALPEDVGGAGYGVARARGARRGARAGARSPCPCCRRTRPPLPLLWAGADAAARERWLGPARHRRRGRRAGPGRARWPQRAGRTRRCAAAATDDGWALSGTKLAVPFGARADVLVVSADLGDGTPVPAGGARAMPRASTGAPTTPSRPSRSPRSRSPTSSWRPDDVVGEPGRAATVLERALAHRRRASTPRTPSGWATPRSRSRSTTPSNREQFGRPIGVNQAVSHQCVDMRVEIDAMRVLVHQAAWRLDRPRW